MFEHTNRKIVEQLPLAIKLNAQATFEDFLWSNNHLLKKHLEEILDKSAHKIIYIWGARGTGKSHLMQAMCHALTEMNQSSIYLPLKVLSQLDGSLLEDLENQSLVILDDIDMITQNPQWEEGIFHLFNKVRDNEQGSLIITGNCSVQNLNINLQDLKSRLISCLAIELLELNDDEKSECLIMHALKKGLKLSPKVANFLINRSARNMIDLQEILDKIDEASLRAQHKITIPFIKSVLNL